MKIGINALFLQTPTNGSGQYLIQLLNALSAIDQQNSYLLLGAKPLATTVQEQLAQKFPFPYQVSPVPAAARRRENVEKLVWEQFTGPVAARKAGVDLLHVPYFAPSLF